MKEENPSDPTVQFYDELAADYHYIFQDWDRSMQRQAHILDQVIKKYTPRPPETLLDCSCGIGTQAIGLAQLGYQVHGTDISSISVARARKEAAQRKIHITWEVADFRSLEAQVEGTFDVVIACDNALPHLLQEAELLEAAQNIHAKMNAEGLFIASIRDYDQLVKEKPISIQPTQTDTPEGKIISFQTWDWVEDRTYQVNHFTLKGTGIDYQTFVRTTYYRAYQREEVSRIFSHAGFQTIQWLMPAESGYYQPIMLATP